MVGGELLYPAREWQGLFLINRSVPLVFRKTTRTDCGIGSLTTNMIETQTPNGGWMYRQPQTGFVIDRNSKPNSVSVTLDQAAELVQKHRLKNPQFNLPVAFHAVRAEVLEFNRHRLGLPPSDAPPKSIPQRSHAAVAVEHLGKTAAGIRLVVDWLGSGLRPVQQAEAEQRASICVGATIGSNCPQNQTGDLWQRLDAKAADGLKRLISIKADMSLATSQDAKLRTCLACDCHLPLKVHAPMAHILANTSSEVMAQLDPRCWILKGAAA